MISDRIRTLIENARNQNEEAIRIIAGGGRLLVDALLNANIIRTDEAETFYNIVEPSVVEVVQVPTPEPPRSLPAGGQVGTGKSTAPVVLAEA